MSIMNRINLEEHIKINSLDEEGNLELELTEEGEKILEELRIKKGFNTVNDLFNNVLKKAVYLKGKKNADRKGQN